jgi:hypothetical protein
MFLLQCSQHSTSSSVYNHQASFFCWTEAIYVGNVMPSTWGLLHNRTNQLSVEFSEHLSLRVFLVCMFLVTLAVYLDVCFFYFENTFTVVVAYIFVWSFVPVRCRCWGLLLLNYTLTHTQTHAHAHSVPLFWTRDRSVAETSTCATRSIHKRQTSMPSEGFEHNSSKRAAADLRVRPRGFRLYCAVLQLIYKLWCRCDRHNCLWILMIKSVHFWWVCTFTLISVR